jgi:hypothetical protein
VAKRNAYFGDFRAAYDIAEVHGNAVWLIDMNGVRSVANDAERVCSEVNQLYRHHRIFYRDTEGNWGELRHRDGQFIDFAPARFAGHPQGVPITNYKGDQL